MKISGESFVVLKNKLFCFPFFHQFRFKRFFFGEAPEKVLEKVYLDIKFVWLMKHLRVMKSFERNLLLLKDEKLRTIYEIEPTRFL
jgi:hypothetical protein